ncbi:phosphate ABC transporter membrane protein 1, PhoT family (TC 3.A.1.7.1) [Halogranum rubrum]|uniref:Phosphate transport system permease protein n=2 Tax=Halogranum rubrum TaxID=553466 RepID=A0A1I4BTY4_9EURY|nr:phosphate ABC transporter membrane protein 1, PhoT family (TC 3.A.1.7.1) [Halogranum rubrum]
MTEQSQPPDLTGNRGMQQTRETLYHVVFFACAALSVVTTVGIIVALLGDALSFFGSYSIVEFLTGTQWSVLSNSFGVLPLVYGTLIVTFGSALIAMPLGLLTAIYLSEYASKQMRSVLKPMLEILAGVPTVVYGYFAIVYITPFLEATLFPSISTFNALSASIVVGIMIIPMVASISEDAMSAVPDSLRQAGYGLGATKFNVSTRIVVPAAISGIASSFILALSRAIGETMAVTLAMGSKPGLPSSLHPGELFLRPYSSMTAQMVNTINGELSGGSAAYDAVFAVGLVLFVITLVMNIVSDRIASRYREEY